MGLSQENAALIQYLRDAGVPAVVTATTNGTHTTNSYHGRQGTGAKGLAVDFGWNGDKRYDPHYLAIFNAFARVAPQLAELIYTDTSYSIENGKRIVTQQGHTTHVHVAVNKGVFVKWPGPVAAVTGPTVVLPASVQSKEDDMPKLPTDIVDAVSIPNLNGTWCLQRDGGVITHGDAPFYGSYWSFDEKERQGGPREFIKIEYRAEYDGYRIIATDGGWWDCRPK